MSEIVKRMLRELRPDEFRETGPAKRLQVLAELISDPLGQAASAEEDGESPDGVARPTSWMQRLRRRTQDGVGVRPVSGQVTFSGRVCCADWLSRFDGRHDLPTPFETQCPTCQARYRIALKFV